MEINQVACDMFDLNQLSVRKNFLLLFGTRGLSQEFTAIVSLPLSCGFLSLQPSYCHSIFHPRIQITLQTLITSFNCLKEPV